MTKYTKITIDDLIQRLEQEKKKGGIIAAINGTLLVLETGNSIVATTEKYQY